MTDFATLKALVEDEAEQIDNVTAKVGTHINWAVKFFERNWNFKYMERFVEFTYVVGQRNYALPARPKAFILNRLVNDDGTYTRLPKVDPRDVAEVLDDKPTCYWLDGIDNIWYNSSIPEAYSGELSYIQYSADLVNDADENWLTIYATDCIVQRAMITLSVSLHEPEAASWYQNLLKDSINTLLQADEQMRGQDAHMQMLYGG